MSNKKDKNNRKSIVKKRLANKRKRIRDAFVLPTHKTDSNGDVIKLSG